MANQFGFDFGPQDVVLTNIEPSHENHDMFASNQSYNSFNTTENYGTSYESIGFSDTQFESSVDNNLRFHAVTPNYLSITPNHLQPYSHNSNDVPQFAQGDAYSESSIAEQVDAPQDHGTLDPALVNTAVSLTYRPGERAKLDDTPQDQETHWTLFQLLQQYNHGAGSSHYPDELRQTDVQYPDQAPSRDNAAAQSIALGSLQNHAGLDGQCFQPLISGIIAQSSDAQAQPQATLRSDLVSQHLSHNNADGLVCDTCGPTKCHSEASLKSHKKKQHNNITKHRCDWLKCDFKCTEKKDLHRHVNSVHKRKMIYWCPTCDQGFSREDNGRRHFKKCTARKSGTDS